MSPAVSVIVVTYSPGHHLATFLDTLATAVSQPYEVVLADNGSTDGAPQQAASRDGVRLIETGANLGFGQGANVAIRAVQSEWVVVANPDIVWRPGSLDSLLATREHWPRAAAIGPAILTPSGDLYPSARELPALGVGIGHAVFGWFWPTNPWTQAYRREREDPVEGLTGWLSGSCLLLRRDAVLRLGGFDPAYFMYFEDVDLCDRLAKAGWQVVYAPSAVVEHIGGHAALRHPVEMLTEHHRSAYRYLAKRYRGVRWLPVRLVLRAGLAARLLLSRLSGRVVEGAALQRTAEALPDTAPGVPGKDS